MTTVSGIVVSTGSHAESRRTLSDVINELQRPIDASDETLRALAADAFRSAVRKMNRKGLWPWEVQDEDITITANQKFVTLSGTIKKPLALHFLDASGGVRDQPIWYMSYDRFVEKYTMDISSEPHTYTIPNLFETNQLRLFPTPSSNDFARFTYYRATPAPTKESEAIELPEYVIDAYMDLAWLEFLKRIPSTQRPFPITIAMSQAKDAYESLSAHVNDPGDRSRRVNLGGFGVG